jgi:protein-tyrosine phosphatase
MAAALTSQRTRNLTDPVEVSSAGVRAGAGPVPPEVQEVMAPLGIDLSDHQSRALTPAMLQQADLIIGMTRRHVQEAILLDPPCWGQAFTLKELVRRGEALGPRRADQGIRSWIDAVNGNRTRAELAHRSPADDVADPYGGSLARYRATATELADLTRRLALLLWPDEAAGPSA